ncbi:hypothetical protein DPMN_003951 [Dreissena polymorpha]|uniref:Uncharacterized protein n=1 Tax=Dreissena polymorpha TaxID=45954 RepID=A0A9D4MQB8_DREPO|nr:hypothetical protein DPMN_003951 [Dreissena polymorpha]
MECIPLLQEVLLSGKAQLALYRPTNQAYKQTVTVRKTIGDKSGMWHVGMCNLSC